MSDTSPYPGAPFRRQQPVGPSLARFAELAFHDRSPQVPVAKASHAAVPPLTHHEILELAAPFLRRGQQIDWAASDRQSRKLVFRAVRHVLPSPEGASEGKAVQPGAVRETFSLETPRPGCYRLTRTLCEELCEDRGLQATLSAEGSRPGDLLASVQAVPLLRHFHFGMAYRVASSGCITAGVVADNGFRLTHAVVQTDALTLKVRVSTSGPASVSSAVVKIQPHHPGLALPADMLAVLGWDWSLLQATAQGWQGSVRLRARPGARGSDIEHKLCAAGQHLGRTLAEPPPRFHDRLRLARLQVLARHGMPLLACALLVLAALFADVLRATNDSLLTLGLICISPAIFLLFLLRSEGSRLALPPWPRPLPAGAWGTAP